MRIAVVRNRAKTGVISTLGRPCPEVYGRQAVQRVIDALGAAGHEVAVFEGDMTMLPGLQEFFAPTEPGAAPSGMVFNLAYGVQGDCRYTHVPAMLEMAGVPYTGSSPLGHTLALDKVITKILMIDAGIPTPPYCVMEREGEPLGALRFPLVVKPRHESSSFGLRLVNTRDELDAAVAGVVAEFRQSALVEQYVPGREFAVALLGNAPVRCLPVVEVDFGNRHLAMMTHEDKMHRAEHEPRRVCPAPIDEALAERLRNLARRTFHACHLRDYGRVDVRVDAEGNPFVLEINSMASLGWGGSYVLAARQDGFSFPELVARIVDAAQARQPVGVPRSELRAGVAGEAG